MVLGIITSLVLSGYVGSEGTRAQYGVTIECQSSEHYVEKEQYTYYLIKISNIGDSEDSYNLTMDPLPEHWQAELNTSELTIPSGQYRNVMLKVKTTCECEFGERLLLNVTATSQSDADVFDRVLTVTTYATVKVVLDSETDYMQLPRGESHVHEISVRNEGSEEDTFGITVSQSTALSSVLETEFITLPINTSGNVNITITASSSAPYGYHELDIGAESIHNSEESEFLTITVIVGEISLKVEEIELSSTDPKEGDTVTISFDVSNTGSADAANMMITVHYLFKNGSKSEIGSEMASIDADDKVTVQRDIIYSSDFQGITIEAKIEGKYGIWEESLTPKELGFGQEKDNEFSILLVGVIIIVLIAVTLMLIIIKNKKKKKV
jgi:hypothetical protein